MINYKLLQNEILIFHKIAFSRILDARKKSKKKILKISTQNCRALERTNVAGKTKVQSVSRQLGFRKIWQPWKHRKYFVN